jgi:2-polyprenyl-6-methoxyphenol hydroxylase-like FAD-dependent oxidoreductase
VVQAAADALPAPIAELMAASRACMGVSAVSDLVLSGCVIDSKLVLVGQAGSVIRPHTYTTAQQAVHDATSLAHALKASKFVLERALPRWEQQQVAHNVSQCRAAMAAGERMQGFTSC